MADKKPKEKDGFVELIKKLWSPVAGILGAVTSLFNFYQLWSGNQETITYIFAGGGLVFLIIALAWIAFSKKNIPKRGNRKVTKSVARYSLPYRRAAWSGLAILTLLVAFGAYFLLQHRTEQQNKLIVIIAEFEGPEDVHGLRNRIVESLNSDFSEDENIEIKLVDEVITLSRGSEYARQLGKNHLADIVIWGWYREENPSISIHIENLSSNQLLPLQESENFQPATTLSEKDFSTFIQQSGDETSSLIAFLAGFIEYQSENYQNAIKYFDISFETLPESPLLFENQHEIYFFRGVSNLYLTNYEPAIQNFNQAIQINPQDANAYINRGVAYINLGNYQSAIEDYDQAIQINPQNVNAYINRGTIYTNLGDYQNAFQDFDQAIQINPQYANAYLNRGVAYADLGDYQNAIQDYDQVIKINPQDANAYLNRGVAYADLGDYQKALKDFDQAIKINPQDADAFYNRGITYADLGDYQNAIQDYDQAIKINPQDADAFYNRGTVYVNLGDYQNAIQDFDQAIHINSQYADAYYNRGATFANLGDYQSAIQDFDKAIQINPQDVQIYYYRGLAYQVLGKTAEAEADFAKYKELTGQDAP